MPYYLSRTGEPLKVVCHIRDEAHRFGITFHRQKRSKGFIHSELENIEGVGPKTIELLLRHFRTVEKIRTAPAARTLGPRRTGQGRQAPRPLRQTVRTQKKCEKKFGVPR